MSELNVEPPEKPESLLQKLKRLLLQMVSVLRRTPKTKNAATSVIHTTSVKNDQIPTFVEMGAAPNLETIQQNLRNRFQGDSTAPSNPTVSSSAANDEKFSVEVIKDDNTGDRLIIRDASGKAVIEQG
jgi:hypothetical protein